MSTIRGFALFFAVVLAVPGQTSGSESGLIVSLQPTEVFQGEVVALRVIGGRWTRVQGGLHDRWVPFFPDSHGSYTALLGVDLDEKPGELKIAVKGWTDSATQAENEVRLKIKKKSFPIETLKVPEQFDDLTKEVQERIYKEHVKLSRLWTISTPERYWEGRFMEPVPGGITAPFGLRRVINGAPRSPHSGVDLKAATGTPIAASNHGKVVLRDDFFFSGKSVVLDHGGGLYTMYFHLADFNVEEGAQVRKGDLIGSAGMTGRVTGPHLHWGARLNGARIDPFDLIEKLSGKS